MRWAMVPFSALWLVLTVWLGRRYLRLERGEKGAAVAAPVGAAPESAGA